MMKSVSIFFYHNLDSLTDLKNMLSPDRFARVLQNFFFALSSHQKANKPVLITLSIYCVKYLKTICYLFCKEFRSIPVHTNTCNCLCG